jgi:hypothetical protein
MAFVQSWFHKRHWSPDADNPNTLRENYLDQDIPPRHFQAIAQAAAEGSLGAGRLVAAMHQGNFPALAE